MSKEAMKLALKALRFARDDGYENEVSQDAITALREALVEQPAKQDIPDLIAGTLGVSRGTAYDLMREALAQERSSDEQPAQPAVPLTNEQITKAFNEAMSKRPKDASNAETNRLFARAIEAAHGIGEKK